MIKRLLKILKFPDEENGLSEELRSVVGNRLVVLIIVLSFVYYLVDRGINSNVTSLLFISVSTACLVVLIINGNGYFRLAKIIGLLLFNFILYNISASQDFSTGVHLHQITAAFVALILFGYEDRWWGIAFTMLTFCLFALAFFTKASLLTFQHFNEYQISILFMLNITVFAAINLYLTYMILRLNYKVEQTLLFRNQELKRTNVELDRFVYSASHDLRAPLNSIAGLINLQRLDPQSTVYSEMIQSRVTIMDKFIRDIIDYSRNSRVEVMKEPIRLKSIVQEIIEMLRVSQVTHSIDFQIEMEDSLEIISDLARIRVILNNLISNAIKYADQTKGNSFVRIRAWHEQTRSVISVEDNGIGIEPGLLPKIFEMFYRATTVSTGSGLGLYIVKESLEKVKGTIEVQSEFTKGTTFRIVLHEKL
jgi:signal transduction histidine kinase